jgi:DNA-3-methyladenine glycosylase II
VRSALLAVRGIGPWSAAIYLLMALRRPDVWPPGDLALHKALARLRGQDRTPSTAEAERYARRWRPWRAVAARILWHGYLSERSDGPDSPRRRYPGWRPMASLDTMRHTFRVIAT